MKRIALSAIAVSFVATVAAGPAMAGTSLDNAVYKAVTQGQETKKVKTYDGHHFNIKPVKATRLGSGGFSVTGQLSHHLRLRTDDQYYYTIEIDRAGTILKIDEKIDRGGLTTMLLKLPVGEIVQTYSGNKIPAPVANKGIEEAGRWLGKKLDGSWEGAARKVVVQIGMQVSQTHSLTPKAYAMEQAEAAKAAGTSSRPGRLPMREMGHGIVLRTLKQAN